MDGFEKHVRKHKKEFDDHMPDRGKMWSKIQEALRDTKEVKTVVPIWKQNWFQMAASVLLVVGFILALQLVSFSDNSAYASPSELIEIDRYYENIVAEQVKLINESPKLSLEEKEEFLDFMVELDQEYENLKNEFSADLDNEKVLEAIVFHYQKRIQIIQSLLDRINKSNNKQDEKGILL